MNPQSAPSDLSRLHDLVVPPPAPLWPPAPGWYIVLPLLAILLALTAWRGALHRRANRFRRTALAELAEIERLGELDELPGLMKRTALTAFPRAEVAALEGEAWLRFLDRTGATDAFTRGPGRPLQQFLYDPEVERSLTPADVTRLFAAARHWLKQHRADRTISSRG